MAIVTMAGLGFALRSDKRICQHVAATAAASLCEPERGENSEPNARPTCTRAEPAGNFRRAAETNPFNDTALLCHGVMLAKAGQTAAGLAWVQTAVERNPENEAARRMLVEIEKCVIWRN